MLINQIDKSTLVSELKELKLQYTRLKDDDLFVLWFLGAYIVDNMKDAIDSIAGGSKDKGIDAIFIDDNSRAVFIVQGKYREKVGQKS